MASSVAFGQPAQTIPEASETVTVTGHRDVDAVVSQFVAQHAATNRKTGQYMRDDAGPVCPVTIGLPDAFNAFVTARVLDVAASVGAKTGIPGRCKPNVEVLFTDQPRALIKSLSDQTKGVILGAHAVGDTPRLLEITHPVQAWYLTGTRIAENSTDPATRVGMDGNARSADDRAIMIDDVYRNPPPRVGLGSRLPARRISSLVNILILADSGKVSGLEIGPVSDYIAMLALSEPQSLDACNQLPSILDLFVSNCSGRSRPTSLTDSDLAYLKALYAADLGATTNSMQKKGIDENMKGNLQDR